LAPESTTIQGDIPMPFIAHLTTNLALRKATPKRLTDDEIWEKIKISAISEFRKIVIAVVGRAKQARWSADKLAREGQGSDVPLLLAICAEFMAKHDWPLLLCRNLLASRRCAEGSILSTKGPSQSE
jgi:hypothetical protein